MLPPREQTLREYAERLVATWPPATEQLRARLSILLRPALAGRRPSISEEARA